MPDPADADLYAALAALRDRGAIGESSLRQAVEHAEAFVAALSASCARILDLGSGGGLPGLVIAVRRPDATLVLADRRQRRMDLLRLACIRLDLSHRVRVVTADVGDLASDPAFRGQFDAVTARAFADAMSTAAAARPFLRVGGMLVVSEPPSPSPGRWDDAALATLGLRRLEEFLPHVQRLEACSEGCST